jgi:hypothetical protein
MDNDLFGHSGSHRMNTTLSSLQRAAWLIIGLSVLPHLPSAGAEPKGVAPAGERLEFLMTAHDVRYAIQVSRRPSSECLRSESQKERGE